MLLANEDIERIVERTNLSRNQFSILNGGYLRLRNKDDYCIFLNPKERKCSIYDIRPIGCRFYPVIYDPYLKKCVVDKDCSNKYNVPSDLIIKKCSKLENFIKKLEKERKDRLTRKD